MNQPAAASPFPDPILPPRPAGGLGRLARLTRKELREILRDRRTLITLALMPILLYPLLSIGFKHIFANSLPGQGPPVFRLAVRTAWEGEWIGGYLGLRTGRPNGRGQTGQGVSPEDDNAKRDGPSDEPLFHFMVPNNVDARGDYDLETAVRNFHVDVGVRILNQDPPSVHRDIDLAADIELVYLQGGVQARQAVDFLEKRLAEANGRFLKRRLAALGVAQRAVPVQATHVPIVSAGRGPSDALRTLVPLILILMTITGAVYPAIDLTAGERERGTLEILVAAPVPRLGLLIAKYVSVLTVALLTALVNLATMTVTILVGGLGQDLFGPDGLTATIVLQVLGLLLLFATFFSAVLLTLTSFARSFKEAQAYLIPLMMVSIAPGLLSLVPGLRLSGPLTIAPLANIVLLARDLLDHRAEPGVIAVVVISTLLYALAALSIAARFFAAEAVLYSTESGWSDLFRRPAQPQDVPTLAAALFSLALVFPAFYTAVNLIARLKDLDVSLAGQLAAIGLATGVVFAGIPLVAARLGRVYWATGLRLAFPSGAAWLAFPAALLLGLSLWTVAHESVVVQMQLGWVRVSSEQLQAVEELATKLRGLSPALVVLSMALVPAVCEELFFRGFLFASLGARVRPWTTILVSAGLFGLFHVVTPGGIVFAKLIPTTFLGLVLGWVAWKSGSVLPGMLLHACHNGFLMLVLYYQPQLKAAGWGVKEQAHLPILWLLASGGVTLVAVAIVLTACRPARL